jgi:hypothetical protein
LARREPQRAIILLVAEGLKGTERVRIIRNQKRLHAAVIQLFRDEGQQQLVPVRGPRSLLLFSNSLHNNMKLYNARAQERETQQLTCIFRAAACRRNVIFNLHGRCVSRLSQGLPHIYSQNAPWVLCQTIFLRRMQMKYTLSAQCALWSYYFGLVIYLFFCMFEVRRALYDQIAGANKKLFWFHSHTHTIYDCSHGFVIIPFWEFATQPDSVFMITGVRAFDQGKTAEICLWEIYAGKIRTCFLLIREIEQFFIIFCRLDWTATVVWRPDLQLSTAFMSLGPTVMPCTRRYPSGKFY